MGSLFTTLVIDPITPGMYVDRPLFSPVMAMPLRKVWGRPGSSLSARIEMMRQKCPLHA